MEPATPVNPQPSDVIEAQVRECFGRVVYSHKAHEKSADIAERRLAHTKLMQIILAAITTGGLLTIAFGPADKSRLAAGIAALVSTALLALNAYTKEHDLGKIAQQHKDAADRLWVIRESYLSLLTDLRAGAIDVEGARRRRDDLQMNLADAYASVLRTNPKGYAAAQQALQMKEDLTFSDEEIDRFLPGPLKRLK